MGARVRRIVQQAATEGHTARDIAEDLLQRTGDAILSADFAAMETCFALPVTVDSLAGETILETSQQHRQLFDRLVQGYASNNITDHVRICEVAEFVSPTRIRSLHIAHLMSGDLRIGDPTHTLSTLDLIDGEWRITAAQYCVQEEGPVARAILDVEDRKRSALNHADLP